MEKRKRGKGKKIKCDSCYQGILVKVEEIWECPICDAHYHMHLKRGSSTVG